MSEKNEKKLPGVSFFTKAADILILNFLCMICCIPIITIADSLASLYYVMLKIERGTEDGIVKPFFRFFGKNFLKSLPYTFLMIVLFIVVMSCYIEFGYNDSTILIGLLLAVVIILFAWWGWVIPLFAQFDNKFGAMLANGFKLAINNPRETLVILGMNMYMIVLFLISPEIFSYVLYVWSFVGLAISARVICRQIVPIFDELMEPAPEGIENEQ